MPICSIQGIEERLWIRFAEVLVIHFNPENVPYRDKIHRDQSIHTFTSSRGSMRLYSGLNLSPVCTYDSVLVTRLDNSLFTK